MACEAKPSQGTRDFLESGENTETLTLSGTAIEWLHSLYPPCMKSFLLVELGDKTNSMLMDSESSRITAYQARRNPQTVVDSIH